MVEMAPCPVCGLEGGFHDYDDKSGKHAQHVIPSELLKEPGWVKKAHEELKRKKEDEVATTADLLTEVLSLADEKVLTLLSDDELVQRREQLKAEEGTQDLSLTSLPE